MTLFACACGSDTGPRELELANDTIRLDPGVSVHDVHVRREAGGDFEPASVQAKPGDVVRFIADDRGGHAIVFAGDALAPAAREYLDTTAQLRSPPLISEGATWVIKLDDAPPGTYPFLCTTHSTTGRLTVADSGTD